MSTLFYTIFLALILGSLAATIPNEDEYISQAIEELRYMASSRNLGEVNPPQCNTQKKENSVECCVSFKWMKQKRTICIELGFNTTRLQVDLALSFDGEQLIEHALEVGEICAPLPGLLKKLNICIHAYYFKIDVNPPISFDACFVIKLGGFFHFRINCVRLEKSGKFIQHTEVEPESQGILMLSLEEGNVKFNVNNPIPKDIMDKIEQGWNIFEKEVGGFIDDAGKQISDTAKEVGGFIDDAGKQISDTAKEVGKEVNNAIDKAKDTINSIGSSISNIFG